MVLDRHKRVLYYDCANYYFEIEETDDFRKYGHSKENRPNPIVQMGLFMDADGWHLIGDKREYKLSELDEGENYGKAFYKDRWINEDGLEQHLVVTFSFQYRDYMRKIRSRQLERAKKLVDNFLKSLKKCGLKGVLMITSDAHEGIIHAIGEVFPTVPWQRRQFHFSRNIADKTPKKYQTGIRAELQEMFACNTLKEARNRKNQIIQEYQDVAETAMSCLDEGFESAMTVMMLPRGMQRFFRTSNAVERLNKELKRRSQVIGIFPNEESLIRLMGSVLIEQNSLSQSGKIIFKKESYEALLTSDVQEKLLIIAKEQAAMLVA